MKTVANLFPHSDADFNIFQIVAVMGSCALTTELCSRIGMLPDN